jgi:hypothetical protein
MELPPHPMRLGDTKDYYRGTPAAHLMSGDVEDAATAGVLRQERAHSDVQNKAEGVKATASPEAANGEGVND